MDTKWLSDFLALSEAGSFTRAAQLRHASQAAFSRRIQALEAELNATLVDRSTYPTRLTAAGEAFRARATDILGQLHEAIQDISAGGAGETLRLVVPYTLATSFAGRWLKQWTAEKLRYRIEPGSMHDMFTALVSGRADLLICFYSPLQPIQIDTQRYDRLLVGADRVRPYARSDLAALSAWPGSSKKPVPLLSYPTTVYFGRLVETILERAPRQLYADRIVECEMADVLRDLALSGLGVAWLPSSTVDPHIDSALGAVDDADWALDVQIMAFRDKESSNPALRRLWERLTSAPTLLPTSFRGTTNSE